MVHIDGKTYSAHRIIWLICNGKYPDGEIDHINRNKTDNRIENLRDVTRAINELNKGVRKDSKTGVKGVTAHKDGGYFSFIQRNGKRHYLGHFKSIDDASNAYQTAQKEMDKQYE